MTTIAEESGTATAPAPTQYVCLAFPEAAEGAPPETPWPQRIVWPCHKGQVIARVVRMDEPPESPALAMPLESVQLGKQVEWNADHTELLATSAGRYLFRHDLLEVEPEWIFKDDLDATTGVIDFPGPVQLSKNVLDLVKLSADGDITIHGSVEAATLHSKSNLTIHHGVCGKGRGVISAAGNISLRFATNARVRADGNILVGNEINNSDLFCHGSVLGEHASLISGHVSAVSRILCGTAGSDSGVRMLLELSLPADVIASIEPTLAELKALRTRSEHIRASVEPLMLNAKRLTNAQKEKATELLCTAAECETRAAELTKSLEAPVRQLDQVMNGVVEIRGRIYPDVTVAIAGVQCTFQREQVGPIKIMRRDEAGIPKLVTIDGHNHATAPNATPTPQAALLQVLRAATQ